jgi:hypothetical protein
MVWSTQSPPGPNFNPVLAGLALASGLDLNKHTVCQMLAFQESYLISMA